jgi:hypothetical protein
MRASLSVYRLPIHYKLRYSIFGFNKNSYTDDSPRRFQHQTEKFAADKGAENELSTANFCQILII